MRVAIFLMLSRVLVHNVESAGWKRLLPIHRHSHRRLIPAWLRSREWQRMSPLISVHRGRICVHLAQGMLGGQRSRTGVQRSRTGVHGSTFFCARVSWFTIVLDFPTRGSGSRSERIMPCRIRLFRKRGRTSMVWRDDILIHRSIDIRIGRWHWGRRGDRHRSYSVSVRSSCLCLQ
jgi:hypothetical protein